MAEVPEGVSAARLDPQTICHILTGNAPDWLQRDAATWVPAEARHAGGDDEVGAAVSPLRRLQLGCMNVGSRHGPL